MTNTLERTSLPGEGLEHIHMMLHDVRDDLHHVCATLDRYRLDLIELKFNAILELLICIHTGRAVDLSIVFGLAASPQPTMRGSTNMANKKASGTDKKVPCLSKKGGPMKAVMPDVTLTDPLPKSITLQPLDDNGAAVPITSADSVKGTLTSDNVVLTISAGADTLNWIATIPANTPSGSVANLAATLTGTIQGAPADLTASVKVTINLPPVPVAVDLAIIFG